jgi:hypothetical protein
MTATVTEDIRRYFLDVLRTNILGDSDTYYIAIARSEAWDDSDTVPATRNSLREQRSFRNSMQSIKIAEDVSLVSPRNTWSSGTVYSAYDDNAISHPEISYYVITDENNVYVCVERGRNADGTTRASTVKPTGTSTSKITTADGYTWQYLYSVDTTRASRFLTSNFIPVQLIDSAVSPTEQTQLDAQNASIAGEILNIVITEGGTGYTSAPTVSIEGDGSGATATATVSGGEVKRVQMTTRGTAYKRAKVSFSGGGGSGAAARAVITPQSGLTADPRITLRSKALMFNSKPDGLEGGSFIVNNDFRQVAILKNPKDYSGNLFTGTSGIALKRMEVADGTGFSEDEQITGGTSGSIAVIDYVDSDTIYFHQNETTGFGRFDSDVGGTVTSGANTTTLNTLIDSADVDIFEGELFYIQNRSAVTRSISQIEDIKAIISL